ncbi:hypothetical protein Kpho02_76280 [Kitasatospora phosalacinea]|uniref:Uncharacterized protein n=1 Tax=Kitasatospora phosalacinea TaxID=2065 RepID=A0A9W6V529_9ACTN|nr:hypothetical protein [Kitasatospora phosalacinea]GLW75331.1 hypothetical protein Kpho02_76280 [Kitasatospora phosalacinea]
MTFTTPAKAADQAAEAIRALNHATLNPSSGEEEWRFPSHAYDVIGGLDRMAGGLDQALEQTWAFLAKLAADGHVGSDRGDADRDLADAKEALDLARAASEQLLVALSAAHRATSPLSYKG